MNVVYNASILKYPFSGVERSVYESLIALFKITQHHILTCSPRGEIDCEGKESLLSSPFKNRFERIWYENFQLEKQTRFFKPDLFHAPAYVAPYFLKIPLVLTVHDLFVFEHPEWCKWSNVLYYKLCLSHSIKKAKKIIVPSMATQKALMKRFKVPEEKIVHIPWGVSDSYRPNLVDDAFKAWQPYFLYTGNFEPRKNGERLLQAFAEYSRDSNLKLVMSGSKQWGKTSLPQVVRSLGLEDRVIFPGYVDQNKMPALYSMSEAYIYPSLDEGFGLPVLEAMASGVPCIASRVGALPEIGGNAAVWVDPLSTSEIRSAMELCLPRSSWRKEKVEEGLKIAKALTWERCALAIEKVYESALA